MQRHGPRHDQSEERGIVMITVVLFVFILGGLSIGFLWEGLAEKTAVTHRKSSLLALQICEAGAVRAQMEIFSLTDPDGDGIGTLSGPYAGGTYEVVAAQDATNPDRWTLRVSGTYGLTTRRVEVGIRRRRGSDFVEGLFAKDTMIFNGVTTTDGYDSRLGTYATQAVNADADGTFALPKGHVGSNRDINLNGTSVTIRGNAIPGPLSETSMAGGPTVLGDVMARRRSIDVPDVPLSEFQAALQKNDNARDLLRPGGGHGGGPKSGGGTYNATTFKLTASGSDDVVTLEGGVYFFSDVRFTGGAQLVVKGPSVIYVTGDFDLGGGVLLNPGGVPGDLRINAYPYPLPAGSPSAGSRIKFNGGSQVALTVYAPESAVTVGGNDDVFGALLAKDITIQGDTKFHYDVALGEVEQFRRVVLERLYWRDLGMPLRL